ncbi:hypothetical protein CN327_26965 [Bacillus cereus]|nr:hypothetical protein CN509_29225 [Bacillus cereus]PES94523.1 hypothetical protein CN505_31100 [Bacillus cereus]PFF28710.1 hypothetical protein CN327_26965 [Bacillus cereus]PFI43530.1 hypothetical protein COI73_28505 [Bacillus cereus]
MNDKRTTIYYFIIAVIIDELFGWIIRILRHTNSHKKQDSVEQKLDKVIQLLEKKIRIAPLSERKGGNLYFERSVNL